jgi:hypothetical protein
MACVTGRSMGGESGRREWWSTSLLVGEAGLLDDSAVSQVEERVHGDAEDAVDGDGLAHAFSCCARLLYVSPDAAL